MSVNEELGTTTPDMNYYYYSSRLVKRNNQELIKTARKRVTLLRIEKSPYS
jgi:hypothetical protein